MDNGEKIPFRDTCHAVMGRDYDLIRRICTTTASARDRRIDLSGYRDRGYQGAGCKGYDATMKRAPEACWYQGIGE